MLLDGDVQVIQALAEASEGLLCRSKLGVVEFDILTVTQFDMLRAKRGSRTFCGIGPIAQSSHGDCVPGPS